MEFIYPQFLLALALVAIPIIIHLFNFRKYKTIPFSNVSFLKSVKEKTKTKSQLKHLLILLSRILSICFIVLAFSQPYLPTHESAKMANKQAISIYIDNSFSMDAENETGRLLQQAQKQAAAIVEGHSEKDDLYLIDNRQLGIHQRALSKEEIINEIYRLNREAQTPNLKQIVKQQKHVLETSDADKKIIYILSDFQKTISDLSIAKSDTLYDIRLIKINPYEKGNLYIDSCWMLNPNPQNQSNIELLVRIKGFNIEERDVTLSLNIGNQQKAITNTVITEEAIVSLNFKVEENGWHNGTLSLQDYPITFDDSYHFSFEIKPQLVVQHIFQNEPQPSVKKLFDEDDYFDYSSQNVNQLNYSELANSQFIILDGLNEMSTGLSDYLQKGINAGQSLILFPSSEIDFESYRAFCLSLSIDYYKEIVTFTNELADIDYEHILFDGVFESQEKNMNFPLVKRYFRLSSLSKTTGQSVLSFINQDSFIKEFTIGQGRVYLSSVGLDKTFSNFDQHALFVPILYNMASYAGGKQQMAYTIGQQSIPFVTRNTNLPFKMKQSEFEFIPNLRGKTLFVGDQIKTAGHYDLFDYNEQRLAQLAFNYDRKESDLTTLQADELEQWSANNDNILVLDKKAEELTAFLGQLNNGKPLWIYCICLSLLFIILETLLIRLL